MEITDGLVHINGVEHGYVAEYEKQYVDEAFDHAFGRELKGYYKVMNLNVVSLTRFDDFDGNEITVTDSIKDKIVEQIGERIN